MNAILFAGGVGQRLWPLSRKNSPKQFAPLIGTKSSIQMAVDRLRPIISPENIFISTNQRYFDILREQIPEVPEGNYILEPTRRDVAAAVALAFFTVERKGIKGPVLFQWTDNYIRNENKLIDAVELGKKLIDEEPQRMVFLGEKPRYPSENLGWIELGDEIGSRDNISYHKFRSWNYRPAKDLCVEMFASGNYVWNTGYYVSSVEYIASQFRILAPEIAVIVEEIVSYQEAEQEKQKLNDLYPTIPALHFDEAFLMRLQPHRSVLLRIDMQWADPGTLYSLKEALQTSSESNVTRGSVVAVETSDSLIYNEDPKRLTAVMGLENIMIVNATDVTLVIHKDSVRHIKVLIDELEQNGFESLL